MYYHQMQYRSWIVVTHRSDPLQDATTNASVVVVAGQIAASVVQHLVVDVAKVVQP
jgi:hypothetical protein